MSRNASYNRLQDSGSKKPLVTAIIVAVVVLLGIGGWLFWSNMNGTANGIDSGKYQAVFFTNGQVYFGKLHTYNNDYLKLTDIWYIQAKTEQQDAKNPQKTGDDQSGLQLIKLGNEIHAPQDEMTVSKSQVLFYENLKSDGKVSQLIKQYNEKK